MKEHIDAHIALGWEFWVAITSLITPVIIAIFITSLKFTRLIVKELTSIDVTLGLMDKHNNQAHTRIEKKVCTQSNINDKQWESLGEHGERIATLEEKCNGD